ncbi:hypothetical protein AUH73_01995 [archaeon 13_1_40CM_4_53_4]|nr:MAG: hypothetical protein AUI07_01455 [archaeon 13_2_20CM_2_53_6]OLC63532.1 MAG: hypothetical protein AUH73_01995 [archaeon 13_1_40CM_4_53_4]
MTPILFSTKQSQPRRDQTLEFILVIGVFIVIFSTVAGYLWGMALNTGGQGAGAGFFTGIVITLSLLGVAVAVRGGHGADSDTPSSSHC